MASLPMKHRHAALPKTAMDAVLDPAALTVSLGLWVRDHFCQTLRSHHDLSLCCTSQRETCPKTCWGPAPSVMPCQGFPERPSSPMENVVLGGKGLTLGAGQAGEDRDCILHAQESTKSHQAQLWDVV